MCFDEIFHPLELELPSLRATLVFTTSNLKRMPVDALKIDRVFVIGLGEDPGDTAIVSGTIDLTHTLGPEVVAEGVENEDKLKQLMPISCCLS